jgi:glucosamine-6-phosphate deaminase
VLIPASALRALSGARFYVTMGAAKRLHERQISLLAQLESVSDEQVEMALVDLAVAHGKRVLDLTPDDVQADPVAHTVLGKRAQPLAELAEIVHRRLVERIEAGSHSMENMRFLHTEPHHDDLMLGCLPFIVRNTRTSSNEHYFVTMTSGFTAVSNAYMLRQMETLQRFIDTPEFAELDAENYFDSDNEQARNRDIWQYLDGIAARNREMSDEGAARRFLRNLMFIGDETRLRSIPNLMEQMVLHFKTVYPGKEDRLDIKKLKGACREWEAECLWGYFGWQSSNIRHVRLGFYTGKYFTKPTLEEDVPPIIELLEEVRPDVVSVAFDPEASGPDTHYKVLQAVNEATRRYAAKTGREDIRIWGYRNVWFRFHPSEANVYVPVSLNMLSVMESAFLNAFVSQRDASFPSYEHDGPFCELAQQIQVQQYQTIKTCLGREWFADHPSALIRATRGLVFLREMGLEEFGQTARRLHETAEAD